MSRWYRISLSGIWLLTGLVLPSASMAELNVGGSVTVATDYAFRGVSQTMSGAVLQAELDVDSESGWYAYAWASNVKFTDSSIPDDGARVEVDLSLGYAAEIAANLVLSVEATAYLFPGTNAGYDYDYAEWNACLTLSERHKLTVGYSDDVFNSGAQGVYYAAASDLELSEHLGVGVELGHYDLSESYATSYRFATLSLTGQMNVIAWQLSYTTTADAEEMFYESTIADRLVLAFTMSF